jgi:hypothetical protein
MGRGQIPERAEPFTCECTQLVVNRINNGDDAMEMLASGRPGDEVTRVGIRSPGSKSEDEGSTSPWLIPWAQG